MKNFKMPLPDQQMGITSIIAPEWMQQLNTFLLPDLVSSRSESSAWQW